MNLFDRLDAVRDRYDVLRSSGPDGTRRNVGACTVAKARKQATRPVLGDRTKVGQKSAAMRSSASARGADQRSRQAGACPTANAASGCRQR